MDPLFKENLITTKDASELSGYTSDYLARLVRGGEITGKMIGHSWLIDTASLEIFLDKQKSFKSERARELASSRVKEYRLRHEHVERASRDLTKKIPVARKMGHSVSEIGLTHVSLRSHLLALSSAFAVVIMGANLASAEVLPNLAGRVASIAEEVSSGFNETFGDLSSHLTSKFDAIQIAMQENVSRVATENTIASAQLASPLLSDPDLSFLQMALGKNTDNENTHTRVATSLGGEASKLNAARGITREDVLTFADDAFRFVTSPTQVATTLAHTYVATGHDAYALINSSFTSYRSLIEQSGERMLALAATTRDTLAKSPRLISQMNLALGTAVIDATHTAIRAEVDLAYGTVTVSPVIARTTVALMSTAGDVLMRGTNATPTIAKMAYLRATGAPAELAPALAGAIFDTEYAGASRFVALTNSVTDRYALALRSLGEAGYTGAVGTRSLANATVSFIAHAPIAIEDAYLGALGKTALALDTITHTSPVAAVLVASAPALSEGEKIALAIYRGIHGIFDSVTSALATLFTPSPLAVVPTRAPTPIVTVATTSPSRTPTLGQQTVNTYPTYTTIVQGVSPDFVNQSLLAQRNDILARVFDMIKPLRDISNLIVRNGDFRGGTFDNGRVTNGISVSATTGTFGSLTSSSANFGSLSVGTTTIQGDLNVIGNQTITGSITIGTTTVNGLLFANGIISGNSFVATSTTATSTFAGSINIDNGGLVYATSTRNVGIGVLSPAALLVLQNSTSTQPIFVASNAAGAEVYRITDNGFVGIGTTTPGYALAVEGSSSLGNQAIAGYFTATTSTATSTFAGSLAVGTTSPWGNGLFTVGTSSPLLHIDNNSGNIGINALASNYRLDVNGTFRTVGDAFMNANTTVGGILTQSGLATFQNGFVSQASSTIVGNFTTTGNGFFGGTLGVTGLTTLTNASTTNFSVASNQWVGGNATTTANGNFSTNGTLSVVGTSLLSGLSTITSGFLSNASSTITTGLFSMNGGASTTNITASGTGYFGNALVTGGLGIGIATTSPGVLQTSGNAWIGGNLTVIGNSTTLGASTADSLIINSAIKSNLTPDQNITYDLGSPSYFWKDIYVGNVTANSITANGTNIGGTNASTFTLNADNITADTEDSSLIFFRGNVVPNALLSWNSAPSAKRFEFNQPLFIQNASASTTLTSFEVKGVTSQTADIFKLTSSTGSNLFNVTATGNIGIGTSTPAVAFDVFSTNAIRLPVGTTLQRPSGDTGYIRYNTTTHQFEGYGDNAVWQGLGGVINPAQTTYITAGTDDFLRFVTASTERMTISNTGAVSVLGALSANSLSLTTPLAIASGGMGTTTWITNSIPYFNGTYFTSNNAALNFDGTKFTTTYASTTAFTNSGSTWLTGLSANSLLATDANKMLISTSSIGVNNLALAKGNFLVGDDIGVAQATSTIFISSTGNVGIGTTSPSNNLHVYTTTLGGGITIDGTTANALTLSLNNVVKGQFAAAAVAAQFSPDSAAGDVVIRTGNNNTKILFNTNGGTGNSTMAITSTGNVGIGTTTPSGKLEIGKTSGSVSDLFHISSTTAGDLLTINSSGNVGIGTTNPGSLTKLNVAGRALFTGGVVDPGDASGAGVAVGFNTPGDYGFISAIQTGVANKNLVIQPNSGNVGIGTTNPSTFKLQVAGNVGPDANNTYNLGAAGTNWGCLYYNGGTTGTCASDIRLKQNITSLNFGTDPLAQISGLQLHTFSYKSDASNSLYNGLIAQEVQQVAPELVTTSSDGYFAVKYGELQWLTVAAIQQLARQLGPIAGVLSIEPGVESQCVTGDTKLRRRKKKNGQAQSDDNFGTEYDEIEIRNIAIGEEIQSLDERTGTVVYSRVNALIDMGEQEVFELVTKSGRRIRTTSNHPFLARERAAKP